MGALFDPQIMAERTFDAELKRCPWCSTRAGLIANVSVVGNHRVACWDCGVLGPPAQSIEVAVEAWNRRAGETA